MFVISFYRSGHQEVFCKKDVLENFAKFTGKHLWHKCFPVNFAKFSWATFFYKTLLAADSVSTASHVNFLAPKDFLSAFYRFQNFRLKVCLNTLQTAILSVISSVDYGNEVKEKKVCCRSLTSWAESQINYKVFLQLYQSHIVEK